MRSTSNARQFFVLGLLTVVLIALTVFILVSGIMRHIAVAPILIISGTLVIGMSWPRRRRLFFALLFGGIAISLAGSAMFMIVGLYIEMIAAVMVMFFGGILLTVLVVAHQYFGSGKLSSAQRQRVYETFLQSLRDKAP